VVAELPFVLMHPKPDDSNGVTLGRLVSLDDETHSNHENNSNHDAKSEQDKTSENDKNSDMNLIQLDT